jgi:hypothetical protein
MTPVRSLGNLLHKYNNQAFPVKYTNLNVLQLVCPVFRLKYSNYTPYIEYFSVYKAHSGFAAESASWGGALLLWPVIPHDIQHLNEYFPVTDVVGHEQDQLAIETIAIV